MRTWPTQHSRNSLSQQVETLDSRTTPSTDKQISPNSTNLNSWEAKVIRVGRLVICSGVISPKLTGANLALLTFLGMKPLENAYGVAVQYGGGSGKVYANGDANNCILRFDIPTANVNYNFMVNWITSG